MGPTSDSTGGAGGIYYTGAPRFQGQGCDSCHIDGEDTLSARLTSLPHDIFEAPRTAGETYHIQVDLLADRVRPPTCDPEHAAEPCNLNLFALEVVGADGRSAGRLCPVPFDGDVCPKALGAPTVLSRDGTVIFASGLAFDPSGRPRFRDGETVYDFFWRAPRGNDEPVSFWLSAVDGDGAATDPERRSDLRGDLTGVFRIAIRLSPSR